MNSERFTIYNKNGEKYIDEIINDFINSKSKDLSSSFSINDFINVIIYLIELRDPYTHGHSINVAKLASLIIDITKIDINKCAVIFGSLIHDLGKIGVPEYLLNKPTKLTKIEIMTLEHHPLIGYDGIKDLQISEIIKNIVLYHHESYDGSGYPKGLSGENIPLEARIVKIADVYDALTSDRPYRNAFDKNNAINIMINEKKKYDPQLFEFFLESNKNLLYF